MVLWSDPGKPLSYDVIIPNVALYWFTQTYPTSYWCYAQFRTKVLVTILSQTTLIPFEGIFFGQRRVADLTIDS